MANIKIRYLVRRGVGAPRNYWQPSAALAAEGWRLRRLSDDPLEAAREAQAINAELDLWRAAGATAAGQPGAAGPVRGTLPALVAEYRETRFYRDLAPRTRKDYDTYIGILLAWWADAPLAAMGYRDCETLLELLEQKHGTRTAVYAIQVLRRLLNFGILAQHTVHNPAAKLRLPATAATGLVWPRALVAHVVAVADAMGRPSIGDAVLLNEWLGQREGDVLALRKDVYRGGEFRLRQAKTRAGVVLPAGMVPELAARLETITARHAAGNVSSLHLIVSEETGRRYGGDNFRHWFAAVRAAAGETMAQVPIDFVPAGRATDLTELPIAAFKFAHLRHTAVVRLHLAGCGRDAIGHITGHSMASVERILDHYLIRTAEGARQAFAMRLEHEASTSDG